MTPDPKWLEAIKPGSDTALALTLGFGLCLLSIHLGWIPKPTIWIIQLLSFGLIICGCFTLVGIFSAYFRVRG
jgi:hypothetical protein